MVKRGSIWSKHDWCDHEHDNLELIKKYKCKNIIEFGCGFGTKLFLDNCNKVTSVEFCTKDTNLAETLKISSVEWVNKCKIMYKDYENWNPIIIELTNSFIEAEKDIVGKTLPRGSNPKSKAYLEELNIIINKLFVSENYDLGFIDAGVHFRGDIVNCLFNKVNIITAHDTNNKSHGGNIYGYKRVKVPDNYIISKGDNSDSGLTIYVKNF